MTSDLYHFAAFGREQLLFDRERYTGSVAPRSRNQKRDPFTNEQREDDIGVEKRARLNKEKQLKRPSEESGLISEGDILIGEKNKLTVQRSFQFEPQYQNGSNSKLGGALKIIEAELQRLVEQKQQQEAKIKELKEALDHAKAEISEEKEARFAAEQKISALTERNSLLNEKLVWEDEAKRCCLDLLAKRAQLTELPQLVEQQEAQIKGLKEALEHSKAETREEKDARVEDRRFYSSLLQTCQQENQIKELKKELDHAKAETRKENEARVEAERKIRVLTEERNCLQIENFSWEDEASRLENERLLPGHWKRF